VIPDIVVDDEHTDSLDGFDIPYETNRCVIETDEVETNRWWHPERRLTMTNRLADTNRILAWNRCHSVYCSCLPVRPPAFGRPIPK